MSEREIKRESMCVCECVCVCVVCVCECVRERVGVVCV